METVLMLGIFAMYLVHLFMFKQILDLQKELNTANFHRKELTRANDDCYGTFKLERAYLEEKLNELSQIQTTIGEIINADENETLNINDKIEIAGIIKEILKSNAKIFIVRWGC